MKQQSLTLEFLTGQIRELCLDHAKGFISRNEIKHRITISIDDLIEEGLKGLEIAEE